MRKVTVIWKGVIPMVSGSAGVVSLARGLEPRIVLGHCSFCNAFRRMMTFDKEGLEDVFARVRVGRSKHLDTN